jgi:hypothetical protein
LNRAAGDEKGSSLRFLADEGEEGIFLRVFVDSPRIRFWGIRAGAMVREWQLNLRELLEGKQGEAVEHSRDRNCGVEEVASFRGKDAT